MRFARVTSPRDAVVGGPERRVMVTIDGELRVIMMGDFWEMRAIATAALRKATQRSADTPGAPPE